MLVTVGRRIREGVESGRNLDQVLASHPTAEFDARYGQGFMCPSRLVGILYRDLTRPKPGLSHQVEIDALRQRQVAAPVHGAGLAPHVGFPRVGTRLATAAGVLLAAERAADLGARRADVDVGDAAIGAAADRKRSACCSRSVKIADDKPCATSFCAWIASSRSERDQVEHRAERFGFHDLPSPRRTTIAGSTKNPAGRDACRPDQPAAARDRRRHRGFVTPHRAGVDQRAHQRARHQRIADPHLPVRREAPLEFGAPRFVHEARDASSCSAGRRCRRRRTRPPARRGRGSRTRRR